MKVVSNLSSTTRGNFPCLWCGATFNERTILDEHWRLSPACGANKLAIRSDRPADRVFGEKPISPGEHTLRLVRENTTDGE